MVEEAGLPERVRDALVDPADASEAAFAVRFQQTHRRDHGQGRRGHGVLPLHAPARAQRGRLRPGALGAHARRGPRRRPGPAPSASRAACSPPRPTTPSAPATCARASARCRGSRASGPPRVRALVGDERRPLRTGGAPTPDEEYLVYQTLVGAWPLERRAAARATWRRRCARRRTTTGWVEPDEAHEGAVHGVLRRPRRLTARSSPTSRPSSRGSPRSARRRPLGQTLLKLTAPGRARHLPGRRAVGPGPRRPRQPPPGRLGPAPRGCWTRWPAGAPPRRETAKLFLIHRALGAARAPARGLRGRLPAARRRPAAFAYARGGDRPRGHAAASRGRRRGARRARRPRRRVDGRPHRRPRRAARRD